MKLKNLGRAVLAVAVSAGSILGMTSCSRSYTVGYFFATGQQSATGTTFGQVATYKIQNDTGQLRLSVPAVNSGGPNPIQAIVNSSGTYLYVLNAGCGNGGASPACPSAGSVIPSQIDLFSIGGSGVLTHQQTFTMQGRNTKVIALTGNFMYALDELQPTSSATPNQGDITAFTVDGSTGRLALVINTQQKDPTGQSSLTYFPVGTNPTWLSLGGSYAFVAEQGPPGSTDPNDPSQAIFIYNQSASSGQLTLTQSTPTPTGASQLTYVYNTGSTIYALDAGNANIPTGQILPYTVGANGVLTAIAPAINNAQGQSPVTPSRIIKESSQNFLWVANSGINTNIGAAASVITAYFINTNQQLTAVNNGGANPIPAGSGPSCIVEDPSNQYVYTANFNDSTISGKKINKQTGGLDTLPKPMPAAPGSPTWCAVTGSTF